jgi:hypothetical protein
VNKGQIAPLVLFPLLVGSPPGPILLAIFLVRGARAQKKGLKTHLSKVLNDNAPRVSHEQDQAAVIRAPGSTVQVELRTPLAFLTLSGGGGLESGAHLSHGPDRHARINGDEDNSRNPPPPPPPPFYL